MIFPASTLLVTGRDLESVIEREPEASGLGEGTGCGGTTKGAGDGAGDGVVCGTDP